ncbi:MAG: hypothetical protein OXF44_13855 [Anaerolineaceae bacterium]|nr:hypothetical protein [Anaerolineaceae bacterium]MCY4023299.1 hypothetical protein [Anaerolineaceae bacterium]
MSKTEERLARLEESYTHLATKADLEALRGEVKALAGSFKVWIIIAAIVQAGISALVSLALRSPA